MIFDDATTIGMVRLYASETAKKLSEIFDAAKEREPGEGGNPDEEIAIDFGANAQSKLDDLFG